MAFSDLGSLGATGSSANNQSTLVLTVAEEAAAGELVVLVIGDDNIDAVNGNTSTAPFDGLEVASITDNSSGGPNNWGRAGAHTNGLSSAQAGASCQVWYSILDHTIAASGTITVTFTNSTLSDATAITARHFSFSGTQVAIENVGWGWNNASDPVSVNASTANIECLRIRGIAVESGDNTGLTVTTNWTDWDDGNSAASGGATEIGVRAEHRISTGTGDASDPTLYNADSASVYVAFREVQSDDPPTFVNAGIFLTNTTTTSISPALPPVRKNGNLLVAVAGHGINAAISVSGTGWTLVESFGDGTITGAWAWRIVDGSEGAPTFSWTGNANGSAIIFQFCNTDQSSPIGDHNSNSAGGTTTSVTVTEVTTTRNNSLVVALLESRLADNCAPLPTNFDRKYNLTKIPATAANIRCASQVVATSGSNSDAVSVTLGTGANWRGILTEIISNATNVAVSPGHADLVLSQTAPLASVAFLRAPPQGNLVLSGTAPAVSVGINRQPSQGDLALSTTAPSRTINYSRIPAQGDLVLSTTAPTRLTGVNRFPAQGGLTLTTTAPSVAVTAHHFRTPAQGSLGLSQTAPTVSVGVVRIPARADIVLSTSVPVVDRTANVAVVPAQSNLVLSSNSPTVSVGISLVPAHGDLLLSSVAPVIGLTNNRSIIVTNADLLLSTFTPDVAVSADYPTPSTRIVFPTLEDRILETTRRTPLPA